MNKKLHQIGIVLAFIMIAAISCDKNEEPEPLSKQEAIETLNSMSTDLEQAMDEMMTTEGMTTLTTLMQLMSMEDEGTKKIQVPIINSLPKTIQKVAFLNFKEFTLVKPKLKMDDDFGIGGMFGTLTWNFETQMWDYSTLPADKLVFIFPSSPEQTTNDASLTISNYQELVSETDTIPTSLNLSLLIETVEVLSIDYAAEISNDILNSISLSVVMNPFSFDLNLNITSQSGNSLITFMHTIKKENITLMSSSIEVLLKGVASINLLTNEELPEDVMIDYLKGYLQQGQVKVQLDLAIEDFFEALLSSETPTQISEAANQNLAIALFTYPQGAKIADVKWVWDNELEELVPYLVFSDGSEIPASEFLPEDFTFDFE